MRIRRRNWLALSAPTVVVGIVALGWLFDRAYIDEDVAVPFATHRLGSTPPDGFARLFRDGVEQLRLGRPETAAAAFARAARLRPRVPEVHVDLGYAYLALGRYRLAQRSFATAIDIRPTQANAYYGLAESLEARDDLPAALGAMRTYLHLTGDGTPFRRRAMAAIWEWETALAERAIARGDTGGRQREDEARAAATSVDPAIKERAP
jgi:tetratricopeptide (TPR) repeat protein